jgi:hypothetical protein
MPRLTPTSNNASELGSGSGHADGPKVTESVPAVMAEPRNETLSSQNGLEESQKAP